MSDFTKVNVSEITDSAAEHGIGEVQEARFGMKDVEAERTGFGYESVKPGKRQAFGHKHSEAEEIYFVVSGSGRVRLDDETVDLAEGDFLRVAPHVSRRFEGGPEGISFVAFGTRHEDDAEVLPDFWAPGEDDA